MGKKRKRSTKPHATEKPTEAAGKPANELSNGDSGPTNAPLSVSQPLASTSGAKARLVVALVVYVAWFGFLVFTAISLR